jgi:hypothetical protein
LNDPDENQVLLNPDASREYRLTGSIKYRGINRNRGSQRSVVTKNRQKVGGDRPHNFSFVRDHELATIIQRPPEALAILLLDSFVESRSCEQAARRLKVWFYERVGEVVRREGKGRKRRR